MLSVDDARRGQTPEDLRRLAMGAPHRRTRERFLALHEIARGGCATCVAVRAGRHPQTVMGWLHAYDAHGPDALAFRRTGGRPPLCPHRGRSRRDRSRRPAHRRRPPVAGAGPAPRWTPSGWSPGSRAVRPVCCRETIRAALHRLGLSWKKAKKLLGRADPARRQAFIEQLRHVLADALHDRRLLVYLDEAHIHQDADLGYGWAERGRRLWVASGLAGAPAEGLLPRPLPL